MSLVPASQVMGMPMIVGAHTSDEVQLALDWAADSIESYCERKFAWVSSDEVTVNPYRGNGGRAQAMLPNPPVTNVSLIMGYIPVGGTPQWQQLIHYGWDKDGLLWDTSKLYGYFGLTGNNFWSGDSSYPLGYPDVPSWPSLPRSLQVTYDHGYALPAGTLDAPTAPTNAPQLPSAVVNAVIRGAAVYLENPVGAMEGRVGEITNRFDPTGPAGWLDEKLLGEFRMVYL